MDAGHDRATARRQKAILVGVLLPSSQADLRDPLGELKALAESAGAQVVGSLLQKRLSLSAAYALGKGKLAELVELANQNNAEVILFDNDLTPAQIRGLEEPLERRVIDRSELILDIFASRARTREAQLQVELAQLQYTSPRLRGMWTHLERVAGAGGGTAAGAVGGIGTRGPGERQIEIDRRIVKDRISHLRQEIREIDRRKQQEVEARSDKFTVSLVGYTNSGKSTLMNKLTGAGQYAADQLFATLDTKTVRWDMGEGLVVLLSDTVGFIRDLPHHLVASFRATLEEAIHADLLLHVVDASSPVARQQLASVEGVLRELGCEKIPQITLLNKMDVADHGAVAELLVGERGRRLCTSAVTGEGLAELTAEVRRCMLGEAVDAVVFVPHAEGKLLNELGRRAQVLERRYKTEGVKMHISMNREAFAQLRGRYPAMSVLRMDAGVPLPPGDETPS
jgi:GTP-binding protein HflX